MAMKELLYRLQPVQIYIVLALSIVYFLMQLFLSHITHALTLLVDSYHMLCNIVALSGCIMTIKHCNDYDESRRNSQSSSENSKNNSRSSENNFIEVNEAEANRHERSLRNTFGWTRIDVLTIFLGAFCFSLLVEAIQTLIHIEHQDTMHHPIAVFSLGFGGLILHAFCYLLIGGYTYHQGSFLHITPTGDVVLDGVVSGDGLRRGSCRLSKTKHDAETNRIPNSTASIQSDSVPAASVKKVNSTQIQFRKHSLSEIMRDISMKESCLILLQTIPASIDIEVFKADLLKTFDDIVSVHDLHIWQMTSSKYVSTVHILFHNPHVYASNKDAIVDFFHAQGITIVTIQPEFKTKEMKDKKEELMQCLIGCQIECAPKTCCSTNDLDAIVVDNKKKKKSKTDKKSGSLLSLNVPSLSKLRKWNGSSQDVMKKSVSESHMPQVGSSDSDSPNTSTNVSNTPSTVDALGVMYNSIDELKEQEFDEQCCERSKQRLPPSELQQKPQQKESHAEQEDNTLLDKSNNIEPSQTTSTSEQ